MNSTPLRIGVIGLGFMGQTHLTALQNAKSSGLSCELTAVCDRNPGRRSGEPGKSGNLDTVGSGRLFDPEIVAGFEEPLDLLDDPNIDAVSICTHTDTHVDLAIAALERGKHVLIEKPVALDPAEIERVRDAAIAADRVCMPAMVMRFWPGWRWLKDRIVDGQYGFVESARFRRIGAAPTWAAGFYDDPTRSGGALVDLHIHDTDFVRWCFGHPDAVACHGTDHHATTAYHYAAGPAQVLAEGGWMRSPAYPFQMEYEVVFQGAVAQWDINRKIPLRVIERDTMEPIRIEDPDGYVGEMRHFIEVATTGRALEATIDEAAAVARILIAERESIDRRGAAVSLS